MEHRDVTVTSRFESTDYLKMLCVAQVRAFVPLLPGGGLPLQTEDAARGLPAGCRPRVPGAGAPPGRLRAPGDGKQGEGLGL